MDIIGFSGLQSVFGGTSATWKAKIKAGLPIKSEPGLRSGKARVFDSVAVYDWLLINEPSRLGVTGIDRNLEQGLLFQVQRKRQELALAKEKAELIPGPIVEKVWAGFVGAARQRLLALPPRLAAQCNEQSYTEVECHAREIVYEALNELSEYNPQDYV